MNQPQQKRRGPIGWVMSRSRRFWIVAVIVGLPALYIGGFGPACWVTARSPVVDAPFEPMPHQWMRAYSPLTTIIVSHEMAGKLLRWWVTLFIWRDGYAAIVPLDYHGNIWLHVQL